MTTASKARPRSRQPQNPRQPEVTAHLIREMVRRLVEQFDPHQIILFGSQARGDAGPDSDVDLLVVLPVKQKDKAKLEIAMRGALHDIDVSKDILVTSPAELETRRHIAGTIERPAFLEGRRLYVRG